MSLSNRYDYYSLPTDAQLAISPIEGAEHVPDNYPFNIFVAYKIRLIAFINGAIYCLNHSPTLNGKEKEKRFQDIQKLYNEKIGQLDSFQHHMEKTGKSAHFGPELYQFYTHDLPRASKFKPKDIALGEAFYTWQELPRRNTHITQYTHKLENGTQLQIEQRDTTRHAALTTAQKMGLLRIHEKLKPRWFKQLPTWAQTALQSIVPSKPEGNWDKYQNARPSILRHIPGEANPTQHELIIKRGNQVLSHTVTLRQGAPTSFNMKDKAERQNSAIGNLQQILSADAIAEAKNRFEAMWGFKPSADFKMPLHFGGLVTPMEQAGFVGKLIDITGASGDENNTLLAREKEEAIARYKKNHHHPDIAFFNLNVGINVLSNPVTPDQNFIAFAQNFHQQLTEKLLVGEEKSWREKAKEQKYQLDLLANVIKQMIELQNQSVPDRNRNLYLAGLYDVATRVMSGLATGNCKSSKDRKGAGFLMADSMLIFAAEQYLLGNTASLPEFNAVGEQREKFTTIFAELYASGHQLMIAHHNSPGSPGIKDEGILDRDVILKLQKMQETPVVNPSVKDPNGICALSRQVAEFNKPGTFWQKFGPRIRRYSMIAAIVIVALTGIALMATGIFSPIGVIGVAVAAKLGLAAMVVGGAVNIAIASAAAVTVVGIACKIKDMADAREHAQYTFTNQMKGTRVKGTPTANFGPFKPSPNPAPSDTPSSTNASTPASKSDSETSQTNESQSLIKPLTSPLR